MPILTQACSPSPVQDLPVVSQAQPQDLRWLWWMGELMKKGHIQHSWGHAWMARGL